MTPTRGLRGRCSDAPSGTTTTPRPPATGAHVGYGFIHSAVDDHTRLAYSEILAEERKETAAAFLRRAQRWFADHGIEVHGVLTDNGSCYRSRLFGAALEDVTHLRTRPYRPQTNAKVDDSTEPCSRNGPT